MAVVTETPWEQVVRFAHLLQSCYRSDASTPKRDTPQKSLRHFKRPVTLLEEWSFRLLVLLVCLWRLFLVGHRTWSCHDDNAIGNPLMSVLLWLVASVGKLTLWLVVRSASTFMLLHLL